jgi:hypothetical protein
MSEVTITGYTNNSLPTNFVSPSNFGRHLYGGFACLRDLIKRSQSLSSITTFNSAVRSDYETFATESREVLGMFGLTPNIAPVSSPATLNSSVANWTASLKEAAHVVINILKSNYKFLSPSTSWDFASPQGGSQNTTASEALGSTLRLTEFDSVRWFKAWTSWTISEGLDLERFAKLKLPSTSSITDTRVWDLSDAVEVMALIKWAYAQQDTYDSATTPAWYQAIFTGSDAKDANYQQVEIGKGLGETGVFDGLTLVNRNTPNIAAYDLVITQKNSLSDYPKTGPTLNALPKNSAVSVTGEPLFTYLLSLTLMMGQNSSETITPSAIPSKFGAPGGTAKVIAVDAETTLEDMVVRNWHAIDGNTVGDLGNLTFPLTPNRPYRQVLLPRSTQAKLTSYKLTATSIPREADIKHFTYFDGNTRKFTNGAEANITSYLDTIENEPSQDPNYWIMNVIRNIISDFSQYEAYLQELGIAKNKITTSKGIEKSLSTLLNVHSFFTYRSGMDESDFYFAYKIIGMAAMQKEIAKMAA